MLCKPGKLSSSTEAEQPSGNKAALQVFSTAAAAQETARWRFDGTAAPEATGEILPGEIQEVAEGSEGYIVNFCERVLKVSSSDLGAVCALRIAQLCLAHCKDGATWDNVIDLRDELTKLTLLSANSADSAHPPAAARVQPTLFHDNDDSLVSLGLSEAGGTGGGGGLNGSGQSGAGGTDWKVWRQQKKKHMTHKALLYCSLHAYS